MSKTQLTPAQPVDPKLRKRKWFRKLFVFSVLLLVVIAVVPPIIGRTSLRNRILQQLSPELAGRVSLGSASLGWFNPIGIDDLKIYDSDGTVMLRADRVQSRYTLLDLILEPSDLGEWTLTKSELHWNFEPGTSNVEDFLNSLSTETNGSAHSLSINTQDSVLYINQTKTEKTRVYQLPRFAWDHTKQNQDRFTGELATRDGVPGTINFDLTSSEHWAGSLKVHQWDCSTLEPISARFGHAWKLKGLLNEAELLVSSEAESAQLEGTLTLTDLFIGESGNTLADVRSLGVEVQLLSTSAGVHLKRLNCRSEFGTLTLEGEVLVPAIKEDSNLPAIADELLTQNFSLDGEIQLGELAHRLPGVLKIRDGVEIDGGRLKFIARSIPAEHVLETSLSVTELSAQEASQPIHWDNPFQAIGRIRKADSLWKLDDFSVTSSGVSIRGTGDLAKADFSATIDLTEFQQEWSRVLDTREWTARGTLAGTISTRETGPKQFQLAGTANGKNISLGAPNSTLWRFPHLKTSLSGTLIQNPDLTLGDFSFDLETGQEQFSALKKPDGVWNLTAWGSLEGVVAQFVSLLPEDRLSGKYILQTQVQRTPSLTNFDYLNLKVEDLVWASGTQRLEEQNLIVEGNIRYAPETGTIEIPSLTLNSSTVAARLTEARFNQHAEHFSLTGQLAARGRLERITRFIGQDTLAESAQGFLNLQLKAISNSDETTDLQWKMFTEGLSWSKQQEGLPAHAVSWSPTTDKAPINSEMTWNGSASYHPAEQQIDLKKSDFDAGFFKLNLTGKVTDLSTTPLLSVKGECDYDWEVLRRRLSELFNPELDIQGAHSSPVALAIPLSKTAREKMSGTFPILWESVSWSGLTFGPGQADAVLSASRIDIRPLKASVAGGTVRISPSFVLSDRGTIIEQTPETIFDQVHLSEEICQNWLKFVSPLTADATRVEGTFSMETSSLIQIPHSEPKSATGSGVLQIHSARMTPGPLAMQIVTLEKQIEAIRKGTPVAGPQNGDPRAVLTIEQQVVPFEIKDGRVTHRDLKMKIKELDISTSGSVGFDETLDLIAEMEIPASWTIQGKRLRDIWGASIQIPIRGTLKKPLIDPRFVDGLLKQLLKGSATNFLENELNKQLNKLFRPK